MRELWDASRGYTRTVLRDVQTEAAVGLHPWERHPERPTRLIVNVEMFAHAGGDVQGAYIDYDPVRTAIATWPSRPHTDLLETLVEELIARCFENPRVEACRVSVVKPDVFNEAAAAGVEAYRIRAAG